MGVFFQAFGNAEITNILE